MSHLLVEAVPFLIGAALGYFTFDAGGRWPKLSWVGAGSVLIGSSYALLAGELAGDGFDAALAVLLDSVAVAASWAGVHVALHRSRALPRRS